MIQIDKISKSFGVKKILDSVTCTAKKGVTALTGLNGSGKTTLLNILAGKEQPDSGTIVSPKNISLKYIPQNAVYNFNHDVISEVNTATLLKKNLEILNKKEQSLLNELENHQSNDNENVFSELALTQEKINTLTTRIKKSFSPENILINLGFSSDMFEKPAYELSGGWQMRLALASVIADDPDIVLLDEPTNYLDIDCIRFLTKWLQNYEGAAIVVSHDRNFLNSVSNEVWELFNGSISIYKGNYDFYVSEREKEIAFLKKQRKKQLDEIKNLQVFIDKNRTNAATASRAQSRMKLLEQIKNELVEIPPEVNEMKLRLPEPERGGDIVFSMENLTHSFGDIDLLSGFSRIIKRGERIAVVGRNGLGKTTLLDIIAENIVPTEGLVNRGHNISISYFKQEQIEKLPYEKTILEYMETITPYSHFGSIKSILGSFLFYEDSWDKKISVLSGGEKIRLSLINLMLNAGNLILLDEPTTHLDINSKEVLIRALKNIKATLVFVSHDSYFIDSVATSVIYFSSIDNIVKFDGNLSEYISFSGNDLSGSDSLTNKKEQKPEHVTSSIENISYTAMKNYRNIVKKLEKNIADIEQTIEINEEKKLKIIENINSCRGDITELSIKLKNIDFFLEKQVNDWENAVDELDKLRNQKKPGLQGKKDVEQNC